MRGRERVEHEDGDGLDGNRLFVVRGAAGEGAPVGGGNAGEGKEEKTAAEGAVEGDVSSCRGHGRGVEELRQMRRLRMLHGARVARASFREGSSVAWMMAGESSVLSRKWAPAAGDLKDGKGRMA